MDVPFHSQLELDDASPSSPPPRGAGSWAERSCAIACLTMVLDFYGREVTSARVLELALAEGSFDERRGWRHAGLLKVLQSFGLVAYRRNWRLLEGREEQYLDGGRLDDAARRGMAIVRREMLAEGIATLRRHLSGGTPVITSVYRPWDDRTSVGHQVVLVGSGPAGVDFYDPVSRTGRRQTRDWAAFTRGWKGVAILAVETPPAAGPVTPSTG